MSEWKQKRFWKEVSTTPEGEGWAVLLDGRKIKTPAKSALVVPTEAMAQGIADEWDAQIEEVDPATMPMTRSANAAIDKVATQFAEVADMIAAYGDSDLLCYRAETPRELADRQAMQWDPILDWAEQELAVRLQPRAGVMHAPQDPDALSVLTQKVHDLTPFQLAAFHDLVGISGSLVLGFAAALGWKPAEDVWSLSRLDETWQEEQWGVDEDASEVAAVKRAEFLHAKRFFDLS